MPSNNVCSLLIASFHDLTVSKGSRFSPKQSAQPFFTVFHNILLKCRSTSSSPSCNKLARADPITALLSLAVGGIMQSQMEAKLVSMNLKSPGPSLTCPVPLGPHFQHQRHEPPVASLRLLLLIS